MNDFERLVEKTSNFSISLRKKKRLLAYQKKRTEFLNETQGTFKALLSEWKARKEIKRMSNEEAKEFIFSEALNVFNLVQASQGKLTDEAFLAFLYFCEDFSQYFDSFKFDEKIKVFQLVSLISEENIKLLPVVEVSDFCNLLKKIINEEDLDTVFYSILFPFLNTVIRARDLGANGKFNVVHIVNFMILQKKINDWAVYFLAELLENNEKLILVYFEYSYLCSNFHQFETKILSGEHFSLIISAIVTVNIHRIQSIYGLTIIDYFSVILINCSDTANLNTLNAMERFILTNPKNSLYIIQSDCFLATIEKLTHYLEEISVQASRVLLSLSLNPFKNSSNILLSKLELIFPVFLSVVPVSTYLNLLEVIGVHLDGVNSKLRFEVKQRLVSLLNESAFQYELEEQVYYLSSQILV